VALKRAPGAAQKPPPECSVCTTPGRCGSSHWKQKRGPRCVGKADGPDDCDCLIYCGDDPWLAKGLSKPCPQYKPEHWASRQRAKLPSL